MIDLTLDDDALSSPSKKVGKRPDPKGKGKQKAYSDSSDQDVTSSDSESGSESDSVDDREAFKANMLDEFQDFESSAKMRRMVELLQQWLDEAPDDKVVIYSQWTSCLNCERL